MFDKTNVKARVVAMGFGQIIADVLCEWYEESFRLNNGEIGSDTVPLFAVLDSIVGDDSDLAIFISDNMFSHSASWNVYGWVMRKLNPGQPNLDRLEGVHPGKVPVF